MSIVSIGMNRHRKKRSMIAMHPGKSQAMWAGHEEMWKPSVGYTAIGGVKSVWAVSRMLRESGSSISQKPYQSNHMERTSLKRVGLIMIGFGRKDRKIEMCTLCCCFTWSQGFCSFLC